MDYTRMQKNRKRSGMEWNGTRSNLAPIFQVVCEDPEAKQHCTVFTSDSAKQTW